MNIPFSELEMMPTRDRKAYIMMHNNAVKKEKEEYDRMSGDGRDNMSDDTLGAFTDLSQSTLTRKGG